MRILVETALNRGTAEYLNVGDVSMLQVAVRRLRRLWPRARIDVLTDGPEDLRQCCPGANPLSRTGRDRWLGESFAFGRMGRRFPRWLPHSLRHLTEGMERATPALLRGMVLLRFRIRDSERIAADVVAFLEAMETADLLVVCGAGGFADSCRDWNLDVLGTLEAAIRRGVPVVMFGQGMGPLTQPDVLQRAARVLPHVDLVTLRGSYGGEELIRSLGVNPDRLRFTGDEAVELAYESRPPRLGDGLGINLRVASYADVEQHMCDRLGPVFQDFARRHDAPLVPVPIAFHPWARDHVAIQRLMKGYDDESDGGASLTTPLAVIEQAGRCRVVATGAYHAAVFALAQGVPVVCLASSSDYVSKFRGLEAQFGEGCATVLLPEPDADGKLIAALEHAWASAERLRPALLQTAERLAGLSWRAYEEVKDMLDLQPRAEVPSAGQAREPQKHGKAPHSSVRT